MSDNPDNQAHQADAGGKLDEVIAGLEDRLRLARDGHPVSGAELGEKLLSLYAPLTAGGAPPEFPQKAERIRRIIAELTLVLSEQKAHTAERLGHVRRGRQARRAYRRPA